MADETKSKIVCGLKDLADGFECEGDDESARVVQGAVFLIERQGFRIAEQDSEIDRLTFKLLTPTEIDYAAELCVISASLAPTAPDHAEILVQAAGEMERLRILVSEKEAARG